VEAVTKGAARAEHLMVVALVATVAVISGLRRLRARKRRRQASR